MTTATCNGITIEYESFGEGEPLLLEMGLGGQLVAWPMDWVNLLVEQGFRVIRYDNRDVGLSSKTAASRPGFGRMVAAVVSRRFAKSAVPAQRHGRRRRRACSTAWRSSGPTSSACRWAG